MEPERDRMKHLLIILLEALGGSPGEGPVNHRRIQEKITAAGLDEQDVAGLLDWIESSWNRDEDVRWTSDPLPESPSRGAFRVFADGDREFMSDPAMGYLIRLLNSGEINGAQFEALLQYAALVAVRPLEVEDLSSILEQVIFRAGKPGLTGGALDGFDSQH